MAGSYVLVKIGLPKLVLLSGPHKSPPLARLSCCAGLSRSQSGTKLPLPSVHVRVTGGGAVNCDELPTIRAVGLLAEYVLWFVAASRYLPAFTLSDVLPLPNRSYAMPKRGVMSL